MINLHQIVTSLIIDSLGIYSKQMQDIRTTNYSIKENIWAGSTLLIGNDKIKFIYKEINACKYMISSFENSNIWYCSIAFEENDPSNNTFLLKIENNKLEFRELKNVELANLLVSFELMKEYIPAWAEYKPSQLELDYLNKFISSVKEEYV